MGSQDEQSAVEDKIGFFSRPYLVVPRGRQPALQGIELVHGAALLDSLAEYGKWLDSGLTEFKRRNGFEKIEIPRYHIPLTASGKRAINLAIHHGFSAILPKGLIQIEHGLRERYYRLKYHD